MRQLWTSRRPIYDEFEIIGYELHLPEGFENQHPEFFQPIGHDRAKAALYRLARHKRVDGDEARINFVLKDIADEIAEFPVYAVSLALREIKRDESPFMPNIGEIYQRVSRATRIRRKKPEEKKIPEPDHKPTEKQKRRVRRMFRLAVKHLENWTAWEKKFMNFYKEKK